MPMPDELMNGATTSGVSSSGNPTSNTFMPTTQVAASPSNATDITLSYKGPSLRELATGIGLVSGAVLTAQQMATHLGSLVPAAAPAAAAAAATSAAVV